MIKIQLNEIFHEMVAGSSNWSRIMVPENDWFTHT